jgi:kynurenine--oxoglutarate transaminase/cysteine-S-conjugate beta-lyase/glutamine--phenylpyruvate transaminase
MNVAVGHDHNQYCRSGGETSLVHALAEHYSPLVGRNINPLTEVTVSVGATEGIFAIMQAFVNEGDEVVVLEPAFDIYPAQVQMAGGVTKYVPLMHDVATNKWTLEVEALERAITPKTKLLLLNSPHNPTGKVFSREELMQIRDILQRHPHVIAVCDEVYEKLVYDGNQHIRLASLPGMWERTLTVSSCGKTFSITGWKVGWVYGDGPLVHAVMLANQWVQYSVSTPTQAALADVLRQADAPYDGASTYYEHVRSEYERKRNFLAASLTGAHLTPIVPDGGFFIMADTSRHTVPESYLKEKGLTGDPATRDWAFARHLTVDWGVTPIPASAFYTKAKHGLAKDLARFAFCKTDAALEEGDKRLRKFGGSLKNT